MNPEPRTLNSFPGCGHILLYRGADSVSKLIQWQTRSPYSHAALLLPDGETIIESQYPTGVGIRPVNAADRLEADVFAVADMTAGKWAKAVDFAMDELDEPYDYQSIFRFITRTKRSIDRRWFCSELVFAALQAAGIGLLHRIESWAVAPGHLALSPKIWPVEWRMV